MNTRAPLILASFLVSATAFAVPQTTDAPILHRDSALEENIRHAAAVDQAITPAKVLRWMRSSLLGLSAGNGKESAIEFVPIVNIQETGTRIVASFSYKF
jgi:hypothetical protein